MEEAVVEAPPPLPNRLVIEEGAFGLVEPDEGDVTAPLKEEEEAPPGGGGLIVVASLSNKLGKYKSRTLVRTIPNVKERGMSVVKCALVAR